MRKLVLQIRYGGIGDHLFYSHIPRVAKASGAFDQVFISNKSEFRLAETRRLVWELNPHLDGFTDEEGLYPSFADIPPDMNLLDFIMLQLGIDDGVRYHAPEMYYKPQKRADLKTKSLYDPNFISFTGDIRAGRIEQYLSATDKQIDYQFVRREKSIPINAGQDLATPTLADYCQAIASCQSFFCLMSGGAELAAAMEKPATVFFGDRHKRMFRHSKLHRYVDLGSATEPTPSGDSFRLSASLS